MHLIWKLKTNSEWSSSAVSVTMIRWSRFCPLTRPKRITYIFVVIVTLWCLTIFNAVFIPTSNPRHRSSKNIKRELLKLSESYVKTLAKENGDIVDGPYAGRYTGWDLKRTMAVLIDDIMTRLHRVELILGVNGTYPRYDQLLNLTRRLHAQSQDQTRNKQSLQDLISGKGEECVFRKEYEREYPYCLLKVEWMKRMWKSDPCYANLGVDGSLCSFFMYLSQVESYCPLQTWRKSKVSSTSNYINATIKYDIQPLLNLLKDPNERHAHSFMRIRITRLWPTWMKAIESLKAKYKMSGRKSKKILIHMGLLTKDSGWKIAENQFTGGPLGELVQWSDLISCLYILGHDITLTSEVLLLTQKLNQLPLAKSTCQNMHDLAIDLIYTDIMGLKQIKKHLKQGYYKFGCLLRVLDSFGTEPAFNNLHFATSHKLKSPWGGLDLNTQQFFTLFPHTPDNSFMGFVVDHYTESSNESAPIRRNQALVYGKKDVFWQNSKKFLDVLHEFIEIHGTIGDKKLVHAPSYVINHGFLPGTKLQALLKQTKIFVGLGFPYEGPAPLEAIANGAVFINPLYPVPHNRNNSISLRGKPTFRNITSQHTYAEKFIGRPHVYTVDINNQNAVRTVIQEILSNNKFIPHLPYEFSEEGMLQRMSVYIQKQNFCPFHHNRARWPPAFSVEKLLAPLDVDCSSFCSSIGRICEPSYFPDVSIAEVFSSVSVNCQTKVGVSELHAPAVVDNSTKCLFQSDAALFSCSTHHPGARRLCPCRTFIKGQIALCHQCDKL